MDITILLLGSNFVLIFLLFVLLLALASKSSSRRKPRKTKVKEDLKRIKAQIESE